MFSASPLKGIYSWTNAKTIPICLGIETNKFGMNFRIINSKNFKQFIDIKNIQAKNNIDAERVFFELESALNNITKQKGLQYQVQGTALSAAGPVWNNSVVLSNWSGPLTARTFRISDLPKTLFPRDKSMFLNDLEAAGYGFYVLDQKDKFFKQLWPENSPKGSSFLNNGFTRAALLQMKTGLGASIIVKNPLFSKPLVVATELGHIQIPSIDQKEKPLYQFLSNSLYNGSQQPEYEDIASERGLSYVYNYFTQHFNDPNKQLQDFNNIPLFSAKEIVYKAKNGEKPALKALSTCLQHFIRAAKSFGVCMTVDTIVLGKPSFDSFWYMDAADLLLKEEFYSFIQPDWIKSFRVYKQEKEMNLDLLGLSYIAYNISNK